MSNSVFQTRDQQYAASAYAHIEEVLKKYPKLDVKSDDKLALFYQKSRKSYGVIAHKLPILIRTAGLAQALVFIISRGKNKDSSKEDEFKLFLKHLSTTINFTCEPEQFVCRIIDLDLTEYMYRTQQVLDALLWYKRFAQSELDVDSTDQLDDEQGAEA